MAGRPFGKTVFVLAFLGSLPGSLLALTGPMNLIAGEGPAGLRDGPRLKARFRAPVGLALSDDGSGLWVCDEGNGLLRSVDLAADGPVSSPFPSLPGF